MTALEATEARAQLGLTTEQLAADLGVTEREVLAWEAGEVTLPKGLARRLAWNAAVAQRKAALERSGLPVGPWVAELNAAPPPKSPKESQARFAAMRKHGAECAICKARGEWATKNLPPLPEPPLPAWITLLNMLQKAISRLPAWLRPAAWGGILAGALVLTRAVIGALTYGLSVQLLVTVGETIGVGVYGGAVGGLAYTLVRRATRRLGRFGDYVTGVVCVWAFFAAFAAPLALFTSDPDFRSPVVWWIGAIVGVVFGVIIGRNLSGASQRDEA